MIKISAHKFDNIYDLKQGFGILALVNISIFWKLCYAEKNSLYLNTLNYGGAERVVSLLADYLKKDFEVHIALYHQPISYDIPPEVAIFDLKENPDENNALIFLRLPVIAYKLNRYCTANGIDMVISFLNRPCYVAAFMRSWWGYRGKLIMCERSYQSQILKFMEVAPPVQNHYKENDSFCLSTCRSCYRQFKTF